MTVGLADKILATHRGLDTAGLPHAFGGALALAFCTAEPRATKDIDVNVFIGVDRLEQLLAALPAEVSASDPARHALERDGQGRLWWEGTPVDVFLSNHPFHDRAEDNRRTVPFAGIDDLPVLACADLAVFKAFFARPKDVVDVATMVATGSIDLADLRATVTALLGDDEPRAQFLDRVAEAAADI